MEFSSMYNHIPSDYHELTLTIIENLADISKDMHKVIGDLMLSYAPVGCNGDRRLIEKFRNEYIKKVEEVDAFIDACIYREQSLNNANC